MKQLPRKDVKMGNNTFKIYGPSENDPCFTAIGDTFEPEFVLLCEYLLTDKSTCMDLGAGLGAKSLVMSNYAQHGEVYAIEPSPSVSACLRRNLEANRAANVFVEELAIGDADKDARFVDEPSGRHVDGDGSDGVPVKMTTLSSLAANRKLGKVDFVTMGVEGFEFDILKNSVGFFERYRPVIALAFNSWAQMVRKCVNPAQFLDWLLDNFREVYAVSKGDKKLLASVDKKNRLAFLDRHLRRDDLATEILITNNQEYSDILKHMAQVETQFSTSHSADLQYQDRIVDKNEVISAYRMILGREPDEGAAFAGRVGIMTVREVRQTLMDSEEFRALVRQLQ